MDNKSLDKLEEIHQDEFIKAAIDHVGAGVVISDPAQDDMPIIYANKGFEEITGYEASEIIGQNCRFLQGEDTDPQSIEKIREALHRVQFVQVELLNYKKNGISFWNELLIYPVYMEKMNQTFFVGVQKDVTQRRDAENLVGHYSSEIKRLSTPIVPVADNISVLPLIGTVDEGRIQQMLDVVSFHVQETKEDFLILDLSAVHTFNENIHMGIYQLNQLLNLMGTTLLLTGVKPNFAIQSASYADFGKLSLKSYSSVKQALQDIR